MKLSKPGNVEDPDLQWTHRWKDSTTLPEITQWQAVIDERTIILCDGLNPEGITVKVRRFQELPGDKKFRTWWQSGERIERKTQNFALVDVAATKARYEGYLDDVQKQREIFKELFGPQEKLLWRTYDLAWQRQRSAVDVGERDLLGRTLKLWVAIRLTTRSFEIIGDETLGIDPGPNDKILLPPVMGEFSSVTFHRLNLIQSQALFMAADMGLDKFTECNANTENCSGAQLDKMLLDHILTKLRRETLELLQQMMQHKKPQTWLTTYFVSFILLHNVALITQHDNAYAEKHRMVDSKVGSFPRDCSKPCCF